MNVQAWAHRWVGTLQAPPPEGNARMTDPQTHERAAREQGRAAADGGGVSREDAASVGLPPNARKLTWELTMTDENRTLQARLDAALREHPDDIAAQADAFFASLSAEEFEDVRRSLAFEVERRWPTADDDDDDDEDAP